MNYTNEILQSIRDIDTVTMEAQMNVASAMVDAYTKAVSIMEYATDDSDMSSFDIFQESFIMEDGETMALPNNGAKRESLIKKGIEAILKLIDIIINFIKNSLSKMTKAFKSVFEKNSTDDVKIQIYDVFGKIIESIKKVETARDKKKYKKDYHAFIRYATDVYKNAFLNASASATKKILFAADIREHFDILCNGNEYIPAPSAIANMYRDDIKAIEKFQSTDKDVSNLINDVRTCLASFQLLITIMFGLVETEMQKLKEAQDKFLNKQK